MEENKEKNAAEVETTKKEGIMAKFHRKREEAKAEREAQKAEKAENRFSTKEKVLGGIGAAALVIGGVAAAISASKRCGGGEVYDPDWECEPGDDFPEIDTVEESAEEINSEE